MDGYISEVLKYNVVIDNINCKGIDVVDLVKNILNKKDEIVHVYNNDNGHFMVKEDFWDSISNKQSRMNLILEYDKDMIYEVRLGIYQSQDDLNDYTTDMKIYYVDNIDIYKTIQEIRSENYTPKTVRIYKLIYNTFPIEGTYSFNFKKYKLVFHSIGYGKRNEPLTEQVVAFDVKIKALNIQDARARAYNIVSDFANYLSVLLDISFHEPKSVYRNFVKLSNTSYQRNLSHERFRTSFIDDELELVVKNNMNGLTTLDDAKKGENFDSGVISIKTQNKNEPRMIVTCGNPEHVEKVFEKHRLEKIPKNLQKYSEEILKDLFILGQEIFIPKSIRAYFRGIERLENKKKKYFTNSSRLYNMSKLIGLNEASLQIALLVASVESLSKTENLNYSEFIKKYHSSVDKKNIDDMYEIRSKLFHSGEFSFFEFDINMNPYFNPMFEEFEEKYDEYRRIIRRVITSWIECNILSQEDND